MQVVKTRTPTYANCVHTWWVLVCSVHEDIDFLFGIMSSHISRMLEWDSPQQMVEIVQRRMSQHMAQRLVQEHVRAGTLDEIRLEDMVIQLC